MNRKLVWTTLFLIAVSFPGTSSQAARKVTATLPFQPIGGVWTSSNHKEYVDCTVVNLSAVDQAVTVNSFALASSPAPDHLANMDLTALTSKSVTIGAGKSTVFAWNAGYAMYGSNGISGFPAKIDFVVTQETGAVSADCSVFIDHSSHYVTRFSVNGGRPF